MSATPIQAAIGCQEVETNAPGGTFGSGLVPQYRTRKAHSLLDWPVTTGPGFETRRVSCPSLPSAARLVFLRSHEKRSPLYANCVALGTLQQVHVQPTVQVPRGF